MNFFEQINTLEFKGALNLNLIKDDTGDLTVSVFLPNATNDNAANVIPPMILKGNANELDAGFFDAIGTPIKHTAALFVNLDAYQQSLKKASELSKAEQDKKNKGNKGKSAGADTDDDSSAETEDLFTAQANEQKLLAEKKKNYENAFTQIGELSKQFKYDEAISLLPSVDDYPDKAEEINEKAELLKRQKVKYEEFVNAL